MLGLFMVLPLLAVYAIDMPGATPASIGLALGIYGLTQALLQIPLGWLSDVIGRKPVIIAGLLVFAVGSVIAAQADDVATIVLGRALQGAGAIASTVMALVADLTRPDQRTKAMAVVGVSIGASFALALVLGPAVASFSGLAGVFWFTALLALAGIATVVLRIPHVGPMQGGTEVIPRGALLGRSLRRPELARLNFGVFCLHFILMACFLTVPGYLEQTLGVERGDHWIVYLIALLVSVAGMLPLLTLGERGGMPKQMLLLAISLILVALALLGLVTSTALFYLGLCLFFVGFNYLEATLPSLVSRAVAADGRGTAMGVFSTSQFFGAFAGGALGGWALQLFGPPGLLILCFGLGIAWLMLAARAPLPVEQESEPAQAGLSES